MQTILTSAYFALHKQHIAENDAKDANGPESLFVQASFFT